MKIETKRLNQINPALIAAHMSDPRMAEHMPLLNQPFTLDDAHAFIDAKEAAWARDGLGHWAFVVDGQYVGWGGFEKEPHGWDFGLVLMPDSFGLGLAVTRHALELARADPRIDEVVFLLPPSRKHLGALARIGAKPAGTVTVAGEEFRMFRLAV